MTLLRKNRLFLIGLILGIFVTTAILNIDFSFKKVYADQTITNCGAIIDASTTQSIITIQGSRGGSILNKGSATVYINWVGGTVEKNTNAADNKGYLDAGDSCRIPSATKRFTVATASSTAKVLYVGD